MECSALRLSLYTDYSLRLMMYLAAASQTERVGTREVASAFGISIHHLQKAVLGLSKMGYVETTSGRGGGLRLAHPAKEIYLGQVVAELEGVGCLVDCGRGPCPLAGRCILKGVLDGAEQAFINELNKRSLAEIVLGQTGEILREMMLRPVLALDDDGLMLNELLGS